MHKQIAQGCKAVDSYVTVKPSFTNGFELLKGKIGRQWRSPACSCVGVGVHDDTIETIMS